MSDSVFETNRSHFVELDVACTRALAANQPFTIQSIVGNDGAANFEYVGGSILPLGMTVGELATALGKSTDTASLQRLVDEHTQAYQHFLEDSVSSLMESDHGQSCWEYADQIGNRLRIIASLVLRRSTDVLDGGKIGRVQVYQGDEAQPSLTMTVVRREPKGGYAEGAVVLARDQEVFSGTVLENHAIKDEAVAACLRMFGFGTKAYRLVLEGSEDLEADLREIRESTEGIYSLAEVDEVLDKIRLALALPETDSTPAAIRLRRLAAFALSMVQ